MVSALDAWKYLHILLFVYWLGADLGVFLLAREAKRSDLGFEQRAFALRMAMLIDLTPRMAFALMFPVGLELSAAMGLVAPGASIRALAWLVGLGWLGLVIAIVRSEGSPRGPALARANLALHGVLLVVLTGVGLASVLGHGPFPAGWLGWKVLLFGLIFGCGIMIDREFRPIVPAFARLAAEGSRPDVESQISAAVDGAVRWVLLLYALLLVIAFLGTSHPF